MKKQSLALGFLCFITCIHAQKMNTRFLYRLMKHEHGIFDTILQSKDHKQVQILYTKIDRDKNNLPHFTYYGYRIDSGQYFYPASTVKLPVVIFALEKLEQLQIPGFTKESTMITDSAWDRQTRVAMDSSSQSGFPSISHYIKKVLLTSDNDAYNRLYEFVGREEINRRLKENGINDSRILNRLAIGDNGEWARHTNPINFYTGDSLVYKQPAQYDAHDYPLQLKNLIRGIGYMDDKDSLVKTPYSFENKNVYTIQSQQLMLRKLLFPDGLNEQERLKITAADYSFIYRYMSMYPTESTYPRYNVSQFFPAYSKMLFYGRDTNAVINPDVRIFNKYGDSYGYVIDNAYIVDFKHGVEFLLTAVVQSNNNEIYNDDQYEYTSVCYPFLKDLGQLLYRYELKRKRKNKPDLSKFKFDYSRPD